MPLNSAHQNRLTQNDPKLVTLYLQKENLAAKDLELLAAALEQNTHLGRIEWPTQLPQDDKSQNLLAKIKQRLTENNAAYRTHPTHYEYAVLSQHVYSPHTKNAVVTVPDVQDPTQIRHNLPNWHIAEIFDLNKENGLYAALYVNHRAGHCVLAFRGTETKPPEVSAEKPETKTTPASNKDAGYLDSAVSWFLDFIASWFKKEEIVKHDIAADLALISGRITAQQVEAYQLVFSAAKFADEAGYRFSLTGHSLGGWLAQLSAFHYGWECYLSQNTSTQASCVNIQVVTFDNPGLQPILATIEPTVGPTKNKFSRFLEDTFNKHVSTVYLSAPSPINTAGQHLGKVYRLMAEIPDMPTFIYQNYLQWTSLTESWPVWLSLPSWLESYKKASKEWLAGKVSNALSLQTILGHSMVYLLNAFDPATGCARHAKQAYSWPVVDWSRNEETAKSLNKQLAKQTKDLLKQTPIFRRLVGAHNPGSLVTAATIKGTEFILEQALGSLFAVLIPVLISKEDLHSGATVFNWASSKVSHRALDDFLKYAKQFSSFGVDETELLKPLEQYYLRFDKQYNTAPITNVLILDDLGLEVRKLIDVLIDLKRGRSTEHFIANSYFASEPFQQLSGQFTTQIKPVSKSEAPILLTPQGVSSSVFLDQAERLIQLYQTDVSDWQEYAEKQSQTIFSAPSQPFLLRQEALLQNLLERYRKQAFIASLFTEGDSQPIDSVYVNLMLLKTEQVKSPTQTADAAQPTDDKPSTPIDREQYLTNFESIYTTKTLFELNGLFGKDETRYFIAGRAGVGKTVLLQYLIYQWVNQVLWKDQFDWVFFIKLRDLTPDRYPMVTGKPLRWIDVVAKECFDYMLSDSERQQLQAQLEPLIAQGKVAWLIDGYDEIAGQFHEKDYAEIANVVKTLTSMQHVIVTSRPYAATLDAQFDQQLEIMGFTNENIAAYIDRYFNLHPTQGQQLHAFIQKQSSIQGIAHIPINLQMICHAWKAQPLSGDINLTQLYLSLVTGLLKRYWEKTQNEDFPITDLWQHPKIQPLVQSLAKLAWQGMTTSDILLTTPESTLKSLLETGLVKRHSINKQTRQATVEFIHLTFQEFMAGYYFSQQLIFGHIEISALIAQYKYEPHMEITWWFVAGLLVPQPKKLRLFFDYLLREPRDLTGFYEYGLLMRCLDESAAAEFPGKAKLWQGLQGFWQGGIDVSYEPLLGRLALSPMMAEKLIEFIVKQLSVKGRLEMEATVKLLPALLQAKPVLADQVVTLLLSRLSDKDLQVAGAVIRSLPTLLQAKPTLADQVVTPLLSRLSDKDPHVRGAVIMSLPTLLQAKPMLADQVVAPLLSKLNDEESRVRRVTVGSLPALLQTEPMLANQVVAPLLSKLNDEDCWVREAAVKSLPALLQAKPVLPDQAVMLLLSKLNDEESRVRRVTVGSLPALLQAKPVLADQVVTLLLSKLDDKDVGVRRAVVESLPALLQAKPTLADQVVTPLLGMLHDENGAVQRAAVGSLPALLQAKPMLVDQVVISLLGRQATEKRFSLFCLFCVRRPLEALLQLKPTLADQVVTPLLDRFSDKNERVRKAAVGSLSALLRIKPTLVDQVVTPLLDRFNDKNERVREAAVESLSALLRIKPTLADQVAVSLLVKLGDKGWSVDVVKCLPALLQAKPVLADQVVTPLLSRLNDKEWPMRQVAVESLPALLKAKPMLVDQVVTPLLGMLHDENGAVQRAAVGSLPALLQAKPVLADQVMALLLSKLDNEDSGVQQATVESLPALLQAKPVLADQVVTPLLGKLNDKRSRVREAAVKSLPALLQAKPVLPDQAVMLLLSKLDNEDSGVQQATVESLLALLQAKPVLPDQAVMLLLSKLDDKDSRVRGAVVKSLPTLLQAKSALPDQAVMLLLSKLDDKDAGVRQVVVESLPALLQAKPTLPDQVVALLLGKFSDNRALRAVVVKSLPVLLQAKPGFVDQIMALLLQELNVRKLIVLPVPTYVYQGELRFYQKKAHYSIPLSKEASVTLIQSVTRACPSWLQPIPRPLEFDSDIQTVEVSANPQQSESDATQFGHTRRFLSIIEVEDEPVVDTAHSQTSGSSHRYDTSWLPLSLFASLDQYLRGYWQFATTPKISSKPHAAIVEVSDEVVPNHESNAKPTVSEEKAQRLPEATLNCSVGSGGIDQQPVTLCAAADYTVYVFPKPAVETTLAHFGGQTAPSMNADTYNPQSCRPVELYGRQSVFCEGEQTNLIYTPQLPTPPLAQLDGNIMLGQVAGHLLGSACRWAQQSLSSWWYQPPVSTSSIAVEHAAPKITGAALRKRCQELDASLTELEQQLAELPAAQRNALEDLQFALDEHRDQLQELQSHSYARAETFTELEENIAATQQEIEEALQQPQPSPISINPARVSTSFFATPTAPLVVDNGEGLGPPLSRQLHTTESKPIKMINSK